MEFFKRVTEALVLESDEDDDVPDWLYITDDGAFRAFRGYRGRNVCAS